jgi:predicted nucleotidyltransferase
MGAELTTIEDAVRIPGWLDHATASLIRAIVAEVASRYPDLRAALLFGSVARHEERPLTDAEPGDVDLLLLFDLEPHLSRLPYNRLLAIYEAVGEARERYPRTPREVQVTLIVRDLADWDPMFVSNLAHDGLLLWSRGPLPPALAAVEARAMTAN